MKYLSTLLICTFLLIGSCNSGGGDADEFIPGAGAEDFTDQTYASDFRMWERNATPFADADKIEVDDLNMCWAAVAANLLTWSEWVADEDDVFDTRRNRLFHKQLDDGLVDNGKHFLGLRLGCGQKPSAIPCDGDDGFSDLQDETLLRNGSD